MMEGIKQLQAGLARMGVSHTEKQADSLLQYLSLLLSANERMNLTAVTEWEIAISRHLLDSASLLTIHTPKRGARILDVGTGGGLPGMVLAILCPEAQFTLMDATVKKVDFLQEAIGVLELPNVKTITGRAEELAQDRAHRERYDLVMARAVAPLKTLVEYLVPFLRVGGTCIAYKGKRAKAEVEEARKAYQILGGGPPRVVAMDYDTEGEGFFLVQSKKQRPTPKKYPRVGGAPRKNPL